MKVPGDVLKKKKKSNMLLPGCISLFKAFEVTSPYPTAIQQL